MIQRTCPPIQATFLAFIVIAFASAPILFAQDSAGLSGRPGKRNVKLWPPNVESRPEPTDGFNLNGWNYSSRRATDPNAGVPWELVVVPSRENADGWVQGDTVTGLPPVTDGQAYAQHAFQVDSASRRNARSGRAEDFALPIIRLPEIVWRQRFSASYDDVVGIHFHEYVSDDFARILYTLHKVPPDGPDGKPPAAFEGTRGTRLEATLIAPVVWSLDQTVVVRDDIQSIPDKSRREVVTESRVDHEKGHAEVSRSIILSGAAGPQDWNPQYSTGRKSQLTWYWKREIIGRSWDGYQRGVGKLKTLRTSVALVPPTRWSKLLPIPAERITQRHIDEFNREIVLIGPLLAALDKQVQDEFHSHHGAFEGGFP